MKNKIMELADAVVNASHGYGVFRKDEARAALQAEVERVEQELDLLSEGWRVANSDVFHKSREIVSLRADLEAAKYSVDTWYARFMEAAKRCHELQAELAAAMKGQTE